MKMNFQQVPFTGEGRATLDWQDGWTKVWYPNGTLTPYRFRRQQDGGGITFRVGIIGDKLCDLFWVPRAVKFTSNAYTAFLGEHLSQWLDYVPLSLRFKDVFEHEQCPHLMLLRRLHHSWNLWSSLEKPIWFGHLVLQTLLNWTSPVNIETRSLWGRRAIHFKSCPLEQNSRHRQSYYLAPDKTIDLFGGQKVVQLNFKKWEICWQVYYVYYVPSVCFS